MISLAMKFHEEQQLAQILERKSKKIIQLCSQGTLALQILQQVLAAFPFLIHKKMFHIPNLCVIITEDSPMSTIKVSDLYGDESWEEGTQGKKSLKALNALVLIPLKIFQRGINACRYFQTLMSNFLLSYCITVLTFKGFPRKFKEVGNL